MGSRIQRSTFATYVHSDETRACVPLTAANAVRLRELHAAYGFSAIIFQGEFSHGPGGIYSRGSASPESTMDFIFTGPDLVLSLLTGDSRKKLKVLQQNELDLPALPPRRESNESKTSTALTWTLRDLDTIIGHSYPNVRLP